jgi:hypothetical protein
MIELLGVGFHGARVARRSHDNSQTFTALVGAFGKQMKRQIAAL